MVDIEIIEKKANRKSIFDDIIKVIFNDVQLLFLDSDGHSFQQEINDDVMIVISSTVDDFEPFEVFVGGFSLCAMIYSDIKYLCIHKGKLELEDCDGCVFEKYLCSIRSAYVQCGVQ